jgi:tetratricopeptide (TPR) repeat protein
MKNIQRALLLLFIGMIGSINIQAQQPYENEKYGSDSLSRMICAGYLSTMGEFVKIQTYEYAYMPWSYTFRNCPEASKNIYIHGEKILDYKINKAKNEVDKQAYIDTLLLLYDQRIEYFGEEAKVLGKKGIDLINYRRDAVEEAYAVFQKAFEFGGNKTDAAVLATFIGTSTILFKTNKIERDEMINNYFDVMDALDSQTKSANATKAKESVERNFVESGAADCEVLIDILTLKYEANAQDIELLRKITVLLKQSKCQESDLFVKVSEALYALDPSAESGANLAMIFASRNEFEKSIAYYTKAIEIETDSFMKAGYYYQLAAIAMKNKNYFEVKKYANKAINLKPDYGKAYILIGNAYAASSSSCGNTNFEKAAVYLVAVDKFILARSLDNSVSEEATNLINRYSTYFPNNEDAFFEGYTDGKSYTVGCWINETTTIRTTKN